MNTSSIDKKLELYRSELQRLQEAKHALEQKEASAQQVIADLEAACAANDMKLDDVFRRLEKKIERWIKSRSQDEEGIHQHLKSYYARVISEGARETKRARKPEPKLQTGTYVNPYTQETAEKRTRTPAALTEWVSVYGLGTVETWRR
ncbi:hypothetical protein NFC81_12795 [Salinispirillum sp. LH 10-3-1]|uniref:H-NS histone family protein n=1 Tax=Salinispirillum sp. LH 10-3-1 TaxID=2952525 RepID=A0AB38YEJ8_9GAMM